MNTPRCPHCGYAYPTYDTRLSIWRCRCKATFDAPRGNLQTMSDLNSNAPQP